MCISNWEKSFYMTLVKTVAQPLVKNSCMYLASKNGPGSAYKPISIPVQSFVHFTVN